MREIDVVALLVAKSGPKNLHPAAASGAKKYEAARGRLIFEGAMSEFAAILGNSPPYGVREQVVDQTGLGGRFNLTLDVEGFDADDPVFGGKFVEMQSAALAFLSGALEKQFGLRLERRKVLLESLVVDSGNRIPTEN